VDRHGHLDQLVYEIRRRMRARLTRDQIINELCKFVPSDVLFLCYASAAIMERDYGRRIP